MNDLKEKLQYCNTLNEVFKVLDECYDLNQNMGIISKSILINSVQKIILMTGAKKREWQKQQ